MATRCPRCRRPLGSDHCVFCGVIRPSGPSLGAGQTSVQSGRSTVGGSSRRGPSLVHVVLALAVVGLAAVLLWPAPEPEVGAPQQPPVEASPGSVVARLQPTGLGRNPIERARLSTIQLRSGPYSGSAFFFDSDCHAFTNRHVVDPAAFGESVSVADHLRRAQTEIERGRQMIETKRRLVERACPHCTYLDVDDAVAEDERRLRALEEEVLRVRGGVAELERGEIVAVLADGHEIDAHLVWVSNSIDLAVVKLRAEGCPLLEPAPDDDLEYGQPLFTIGNPLGFQHTVTSGVFSGYREVESQRMIQTDAPINSGNSGGPLLTQEGRVVGIATSVALGAQGIGFAIPYSQARKEWLRKRGASPVGG